MRYFKVIKALCGFYCRFQNQETKGWEYGVFCSLRLPCHSHALFINVCTHGEERKQTTLSPASNEVSFHLALRSPRRVFPREAIIQ